MGVSQNQIYDKWGKDGEKKGQSLGKSYIITHTQLGSESGECSRTGPGQKQKMGDQESGKGKRGFLNKMHREQGGKAYRPEKAIPIDCPCRPRWNSEQELYTQEARGLT